MTYENPADSAARTIFGIPYLFPWQQLVIANILDAESKDGNSVIAQRKQLVLLPTGAGKSLCFLVPAVLLNGPTLIIYPLLALMADQKRRIGAYKIPCVVFKGNQSEAERKNNIDRIHSGVRIILANPEVLCNEWLQEQLAACHISHIAIDEVHCVSEWGDSFRPAYHALRGIVQRLQPLIVTGFTATASPELLERISTILFGETVPVIRSPGDRPNIHYEVRYAYAKTNELLRITKQESCPMLIFCNTRKTAETTARLIDAYYGSQTAYFYHAGLDPDEKTIVEKWFFHSATGILVATCAYGMGIDKPDIRTVIHLDCPNSLENFIQESGRGGRDGKNAKSILLWSQTDYLRSCKTKTGTYATTDSCRRNFLLSALGYIAETCSGCDICDALEHGKKLQKEAADANIVLECIQKQGNSLSLKSAADTITAYLNETDTPFFNMRIWQVQETRDIINQLLSEKKVSIRSGMHKKTLVIPGKFKWYLHHPRFHHHLHLMKRQVVQKVLRPPFLPGALEAFLNNVTHRKQNQDR